jgi:RNA polymerase sigma-70 factor (ECF subfamily)
MRIQRRSSRRRLWKYMTLPDFDLDPRSATDESLASKAAEDVDAFTELYRRYVCPIYRRIRSQVPSDAVAEDLTAHVFFKALSSVESFRGEGSFSSWIYKIARNSVLTWRERRDMAVHLDELPDEEDPAPTPASLVLVREDQDLVRRTVAKLPPAQREAVTLRYLQELSIGEVAKLTKRTAGAVRILLHRGRLRLRRALDKEKDR